MPWHLYTMMQKSPEEKKVFVNSCLYQQPTSRDLTITDTTTMKGTRKIYANQCTGTPYLVKTRDLSCFCDASISSSPCENSDYGQPWEDNLFQSKTSTAQTRNLRPLCNKLTLTEILEQMMKPNKDPIQQTKGAVTQYDKAVGNTTHSHTVPTIHRTTQLLLLTITSCKIAYVTQIVKPYIL